MSRQSHRHGGARRVALVVIALAVAFVLAGAGHGAALSTYSDVVFSADFESGQLAFAPVGAGSSTAWTDTTNTGATVRTDAAETGSYGLRISNSAAGQYGIITKMLDASLADSSISFSFRVHSAASGLTELSETRDLSKTRQMWSLWYDSNQQALWLLTYSENGHGGGQIYTGAGSAPLGAWNHVEIQYTISATGGARVLINGHTQPDWALSGDFTRGANLQKFDLWNDKVTDIDYDNVTIAGTN